MKLIIKLSERWHSLIKLSHPIRKNLVNGTLTIRTTTFSTLTEPYKFSRKHWCLSLNKNRRDVNVYCRSHFASINLETNMTNLLYQCTCSYVHVSENFPWTWKNVVFVLTKIVGSCIMRMFSHAEPIIFVWCVVFIFINWMFVFLRPFMSIVQTNKRILNIFIV